MVDGFTGFGGSSSLPFGPDLPPEMAAARAQRELDKDRMEWADPEALRRAAEEESEGVGGGALPRRGSHPSGAPMGSMGPGGVDEVEEAVRSLAGGDPRREALGRLGCERPCVLLMRLAGKLIAGKATADDADDAQLNANWVTARVRMCERRGEVDLCLEYLCVPLVSTLNGCLVGAARDEDDEVDDDDDVDEEEKKEGEKVTGEKGRGDIRKRVVNADKVVECVVQAISAILDKVRRVDASFVKLLLPTMALVVTTGTGVGAADVKARKLGLGMERGEVERRETRRKKVAKVGGAWEASVRGAARVLRAMLSSEEKCPVAPGTPGEDEASARARAQLRSAIARPQVRAAVGQVLTTLLDLGNEAYYQTVAAETRCESVATAQGILEAFARAGEYEVPREEGGVAVMASGRAVARFYIPGIATSTSRALRKARKSGVVRSLCALWATLCDIAADYAGAEEAGKQEANLVSLSGWRPGRGNKGEPNKVPESGSPLEEGGNENFETSDFARVHTLAWSADTRRRLLGMAIVVFPELVLHEHPGARIAAVEAMHRTLTAWGDTAGIDEPGSEKEKEAAEKNRLVLLDAVVGLGMDPDPGVVARVEALVGAGGSAWSERSLESSLTQTCTDLPLVLRRAQTTAEGDRKVALLLRKLHAYLKLGMLRGTLSLRHPVTSSRVADALVLCFDLDAESAMGVSTAMFGGGSSAGVMGRGRGAVSAAGREARLPRAPVGGLRYVAGGAPLAALLAFTRFCGSAACREGSLLGLLDAVLDRGLKQLVLSSAKEEDEEKRRSRRRGRGKGRKESTDVIRGRTRQAVQDTLRAAACIHAATQVLTGAVLFSADDPDSKARKLSDLCGWRLLHVITRPEVWGRSLERGDGNPNPSSQHLANAVLVSAAVEGVGAVARCMGSGFSPLALQSTLYGLLEHAASPAGAVAEAAFLSLCEVADVTLPGGDDGEEAEESNDAASVAQSRSSDVIGRLVVANADYVVEGLVKRLRHVDFYPLTPSLLCALLSPPGKVSSGTVDLLLQPIQIVVGTLGTEVHEERHTAGYVTALSRYAQAVGFLDGRDELVSAATMQQVRWREKSGIEGSVSSLARDFSGVSLSLEGPRGRFLGLYKRAVAEEEAKLERFRRQYDVIEETSEGEKSERGSEPEGDERPGGPQLSELSGKDPMRVVAEALDHGCTTVLLNSNADVQLLVASLGLLTDGAQTLRHLPQVLLPLLSRMWPGVLTCLEDPRSSVKLAALDALVSVGRATRDTGFLDGRFKDDVWPVVRQVLALRSDLDIGELRRSSPEGDSEEVYAPGTIAKMQARSLSCVAELGLQSEGSTVKSVHLRGIVWELVAAALPFLRRRKAPTARVQEACKHALTALARVNPDATWFTMAEALGGRIGSAIPEPPLPTLTPVAKGLARGPACEIWDDPEDVRALESAMASLFPH